MQNDSKYSATPLGTEPPTPFTTEQSRGLLRSIIAEALDAAKDLDEKGRAYTAFDFGYALQFIGLSYIESVARSEDEVTARLSEFMTGGTQALQDHAQERYVRQAKMH